MKFIVSTTSLLRSLQTISGVVSDEIKIQSTLYPNPFFKQAILSFETELRSGVLKIYTITGQLITEVPGICGKKLMINREELNEGVYFYTLTQEGKILTSGKFIVCDN